MTIAEVQLWGSTIGAVSLMEGADYASFQYTHAFSHSGIEISPIVMPLSERVYVFRDLPLQTCHGLPGLLADSLPDKFGNDLINAWLATQGRAPESFNAVERLCYTGARGMGALEFVPVTGPLFQQGASVEVEALVKLASDILQARHHLFASFHDASREESLTDILQVGTSAGGARAKAVIAWNPVSNEVRSGQVAAGSGFEYWLLKFDGVTGNRDKELDDPQGYGAIEYAYSLMAKAAGIKMGACRLLEENGRRHFMCKRFDRLPDGSKLHMQSLGALGHFDFNRPGAYSYEQAMLLMRQLGLALPDIEEQFRRMAFNVVARNQDDHVKNIAFLMDRAGNWALSPAYDLTYSYNPQGLWTGRHQMSLNNKRDQFTLADFRACARTVSMKRGRAETILDEVRAAVSHWSQYAREAGVTRAWQQQVQKQLRLDLPKE